MQHRHEVNEARFTLTYEHDDSSSWHIDRADEGHDHTLVVVVIGGESQVRLEGGGARRSVPPRRFVTDAPFVRSEPHHGERARVRVAARRGRGRRAGCRAGPLGARRTRAAWRADDLELPRVRT
jgi:hypothetical protein